MSFSDGMPSGLPWGIFIEMTTLKFLTNAGRLCDIGFSVAPTNSETRLSRGFL
jgi:hypothetical protein